MQQDMAGRGMVCRREVRPVIAREIGRIEDGRAAHLCLKIGHIITFLYKGFL